MEIFFLFRKYFILHLSVSFVKTPLFVMSNLTNVLNPFRPNPGRREKIKLNFYFHTYLWCLKRLYEGLKGLKIFTGREGLIYSIFSLTH